MSELRFYLDENISPVIAEQLTLHGIDIVSVKSLEKLGDQDEDHLARATQMGRMLCTHDQDFLIMAADGVEHAGIAFAQQSGASIGGWVRALRALYARLESADVQGQVMFLLLRDD